MKKYLVGLILILTIFALLPAHAFAGKWWLLGTVRGNKIKEAVITLKLVRLGDTTENHVAVTSTNKYGQYAFSDPGEGQPPSAYKLVVFVGYDQITEVSLKGIRPGGRVQPITINW
ncbi:hypothetical protein DENIS_0934 [Desulfonema ishimotonii]|uniref:Carboxypeptidase regulatory-like domain-containing protein n=1 Tax=Desulfonema ishimotonii TaxID=45657 RepID=A0A401FSN9_9BACT|nr:hypothetical protein [Desulfonema ishimotonii]GBC59992.1 hypothetical protein DENIS_0934 [Desulfonema ishimotonii]